MNETILILSVAIVMLAFGAWGAIYYSAYAVRSQILGETVWCGSGNNNSVALTFDDGPSPDTLEILDVLRAENVKGTFFLIGESVEKYPEIARKIAADGHKIGNHSFSHPIYLFCSANKVRNELEKTQEVIKKAIGVAPKLARPPCGVRSKAYFEIARKLNLQTIQWSDAGFDWKNISAERIARNVLETAQSDSIILLHDGDSAGKSRRRATIEAVPIILSGLREKGLRVAPLAEICPEFHENKSSLDFLPPLFQGRKKI